MATAVNSDFLGGGGTLAPFSGSAPSDPNDQPNPANPLGISNNELARRQAAIGTAAAQTSSSNAAFQGSQAHETNLSVNPATGNYIDPKSGADLGYGPYSKPATGSFGSTILPTLGAIAKDPATLGVLAAPYAVLGAGAALGGLGAGAAVGPGAGGAATAEEAALADTGIGAANGAGAATDAASVAAGQAAGTTAGAASGLAGAAPAAVSAASPWAGILGKLGEGAIGAGGLLAINALTNKGADTPAAQALLDKQNQLAGEASDRAAQAARQTYDMLGQRMLAFAPYNNMMSHLYGPQAAITPQTAAQMTTNPVSPTLDPSLINYQGTDPAKQAQVQDYLRRQQDYQNSNASRQQMIESNFPAPQPAAPAAPPITPAPARRYF